MYVYLVVEYSSTYAYELVSRMHIIMSMYGFK